MSDDSLTMTVVMHCFVDCPHSADDKFC